MKKLTLTLLFFIGSICSNQGRYAVCTVHVANVFGPSVQKKFPQASNQEVLSIYSNLPNTNHTNSDFSRMHQLLFNEIVLVESVEGLEAKIQLLNATVKTKSGEITMLSGYTLEKHLTYIDTLKNPGNYIPQQYNVDQSVKLISSEPQENTDIYTLKKPTYKYGLKGFSAGTRFIFKNNTQLVYYNSQSKDVTTIDLPEDFIKSFFIKKPKSTSEQEVCIKTMYETYANTCPTTWGGRSYSEPQPLHPEKINFPLPDGTTTESYHRSFNQSGVDASGIFHMICQTCAIKFFAKNTPTVFATLDQVAKENAEIADFLIFSGYIGYHNKETDTITEVRGYRYHEGKVRSVSLSTSFKNINNWHDLCAAYRNDQPLELLDRDGNVIMQVNTGDWKMVTIKELLNKQAY